VSSAPVLCTAEMDPGRHAP